MKKKYLERQMVNDYEIVPNDSLVTEMIDKLNRIVAIDPLAYICIDTDYSSTGYFDSTDIVVHYSRSETDEEYTNRIKAIQKTEEKRKKELAKEKQRKEEYERKEFERLSKKFERLSKKFGAKP